MLVDSVHVGAARLTDEFQLPCVWPEEHLDLTGWRDRAPGEVSAHQMDNPFRTKRWFWSFQPQAIRGHKLRRWRQVRKLPGIDPMCISHDLGGLSLTKNGGASHDRKPFAGNEITEPTFRSLKSGFLDINYCSSCLFCLDIAKPKSTRERTRDLFLDFHLNSLALSAVVNICKSGIKGTNQNV